MTRVKIESRETKTYSGISALRKIQVLAQKGYEFVGNISVDFNPWSALRLGFFLFIKDNKYYQYKAESLFLEAPFNIEFDKNNEPLPGNNFSKIVGDDYIYIVFIQKQRADEEPEILVLLKKNAAVSGHAFLLGPYKDKEGDIVCGEIYYTNGEILLINPKSGSFHRTSEMAFSVIKKIWGLAGALAFYPGIEKDDIEQELIKRKGPIASIADSHPFSIHSSPSISRAPSPILFHATSSTWVPTKDPALAPTTSSTWAPATSPTLLLATSPTLAPATSPTSAPATSPILLLATSPTLAPATSPTLAPAASPTSAPAASPTSAPATSPTSAPATSPTSAPATSPTSAPTRSPTSAPTTRSTLAPATRSTLAPATRSTLAPATSPTLAPTTRSTVAPDRSTKIAPKIQTLFSPRIPDKPKKTSECKCVIL